MRDFSSSEAKILMIRNMEQALDRYAITYHHIRIQSKWRSYQLTVHLEEGVFSVDIPKSIFSGYASVNREIWRNIRPLIADIQRSQRKETA